MSAIDQLHGEIRLCRKCLENPDDINRPLPHVPNPVVVLSQQAKIAICGQAPGNRVNLSGIPFSDPSGLRLRQWLAVEDATFYDKNHFAIVPMGFCFPGYDKSGGDLPPRMECQKTWHARVFKRMPQLELKLLIGASAQKYHLGEAAMKTVSETVANWRHYHEQYRCLPLPHPSWRNTGWLKKNSWFESELLPVLRAEVKRYLPA